MRGALEEVTPFRIRGWVATDSATLPDLILRIDGIAVSSFRPHLSHPTLARCLGISEDTLIAFDQPCPNLLRDGHPHHVDLLVAGTPHALRWPRPVHYTPPWRSLPRMAPLQGPAEVTAVVLNRNGAPLLERLWQSFTRHNSVPVSWIVVDHASSDDSLRVIRRWQRRLKLRCLALKENHSFSASCNSAARLARTPYLLFLNNDIVWTEDALPAMLSALEDGVAAVGMKLVKTIPGVPAFREIQHLGIRFTLHEGKYRPYEAAPDLRHRERESSPQEVGGVTGAALLCRKADFDAIGGFDPAYFYGFEDVDLCLRWQQRGKRCVCANQVSALHAHGATRLTTSSGTWAERLMQNGEVLDSRFGLWLKQAWWHDLLEGRGVLTSEPLTLGVMTTRLHRPPPVARRLRAVPPHAEIRLVPPGAEVEDIHILILTEPEQLGVPLPRARADLQVVAHVEKNPSTWIVQPRWLDCFAYLAPPESAGELARLGQVEVTPSTADRPLGNLLEPRLLKRALIHFAPHDDSARESAQALRRRLKRAGWACWFPPPPAERRPLVDVEIVLAPPLPDSWPPDPDRLVVLWCRGEAVAIAEDTALRFTAMPDPDELTHRLEDALGHSHRSS